MKTTLLALAFALVGALALPACTGVVVARPAPVEVVHVAPAPPARVYYGGHWLYYRSNAYYYHDHGSWVVARSVPTHVVRYHRPVHVTRTVAPHHRRVRHGHHRKADEAMTLDELTGLDGMTPLDE